MIPRRAILRSSVLCLAGLGGSRSLAEDPQAIPTLRVGLITDLHYADKEPRGTRFYRESLAKLDEAVDFMNRERPSCVVELGDFIDQAESVERETEWLDSVEAGFARLAMPRHYVLGNHCVGTLKKAEFAARTGGAGGHDSFDAQGISFLLLDACFRQDGMPYERANFDWKDANVPPLELSWLQSELRRAAGPVIVCGHQRLDLDDEHAVRNAAEVRSILEESGKVLAVFQGHTHANAYRQVAGIHYTTLVAMVEGSGAASSGYTMLEVFADGSLAVRGFRRQTGRMLARG